MNEYDIQNRIFEIRGVRVILDFDLAALYEVPTKALNQAVKRNKLRFPEDFMFRITQNEWKLMRSQNVTASQEKRNNSITPYAFTEQGIAMLSGVLNSPRAIQMNITIMRAFVEIRRLLANDCNIILQLNQVKDQLGLHDNQLAQIHTVLEQFVLERNATISWEERQRIGYITKG